MPECRIPPENVKLLLNDYLLLWKAASSRKCNTFITIGFLQRKQLMAEHNNVQSLELKNLKFQFGTLPMQGNFTGIELQIG